MLVMMGAMSLFWIVGLVLLAAGILAVARWFTGSHLDRPPSGALVEREDTAVQSLRMRFASGEIDEREFGERLRTLERERER